jgi:hypothetical protein
MKTRSLAAIGILLSLVTFGCATAPGPDAKPPANVAGEWLGTATVGPTIGCCKGGSGPVRLWLEQRGGAVIGTLQGVGFRGRVSGAVSDKDLSGSCLCGTSNLLTDVSVEASITDNEMVLRVGDSRMTLARTP